MKYLKDTEINLNNVFIITGDFNIRDNDWDPVYLYHSIHADTFREIVGSFSLELFMPIIQVLMRYIDNPRDFSLVIDLMFF